MVYYAVLKVKKNMFSRASHNYVRVVTNRGDRSELEPGASWHPTRFCLRDCWSFLVMV